MITTHSELLTIEDLCSALGIGKNTAYKLTKSGKIKSSKVGRRTLITRKALDKYIEKMGN